MESGKWEASESGTPQGSPLSPVLANIYLHYELDLWFEKVIKAHTGGETYLVRYCDDFVCCFQYKQEAEEFYKALKSRLGKFSLEIAENTSKIIMFGRFAAENRKRNRLGKPETFDFLGFTHYCGKSRTGKFRMKRRTSGKKFKAKVKMFNLWIKSNRHLKLKEIFATARQKLSGHYRYYGMTDNSHMIGRYYYAVIRLLFK